MIELREKDRYLYRCLDGEGREMPMVVITRHTEPNDSMMGMNSFPIIYIEDIHGRLPSSEFGIPIYGQPLVNLLDVMEYSLSHLPMVAMDDESTAMQMAEVKKSLLERGDLHQKTIEDLNNGDGLRSVLYIRNEFGRFPILFSVGYDFDPHIDTGGCTIVIVIGEWSKSDGIKKLLGLRVVNAWMLFKILKHHDPRLGIDKDAIGLSFVPTESE